MSVIVQLFGVFSEYAPRAGAGNPFPYSLPVGSLVMDLVKRLDLPGDVQKVVLVDGRKAAPDHPLKDGVKVSIFPPTVGG